MSTANDVLCMGRRSGCSHELVKVTKAVLYKREQAVFYQTTTKELKLGSLKDLLPVTPETLSRSREPSLLIRWSWRSTDNPARCYSANTGT